MQEALTFPRGFVYQIICKAGKQALRIETNKHQDYDKAKIIGTAPNVSDEGQLWMIQKVGLSQDEFQIVNCQSNYVMDEEWDDIKLRFGKQSGDQLFKVQKAGKDLYWLKTSAKGDKAVCLEGILRYKTFDPNNQNQLFSFVPADDWNQINDTCVIVNKQSGKAIDVPAGSFSPGQRLIQYTQNKRFNQRWRWSGANQEFVIQNVLTGLCMDIAQEKKQPGSKVVQWHKNGIFGGSNQKWRVDHRGNGEFKIESVHAPGMFLTVPIDDLDDGAKLEINTNEKSVIWLLCGHWPVNLCVCPPAPFIHAPPPA